VACVAIWVFLFAKTSPGEAAFYKGYLVAWLFFPRHVARPDVAVMIHHLVGGEWGYFVRRFGEAAANVLPLLFVLFVPILVGLHRLYPWADPNSHNAVVATGGSIGIPGLFTGRYVVYFAVWIRRHGCSAGSASTHRAPSRRTEICSESSAPRDSSAYFVTMSLAAGRLDHVA